MVAPIRAAYNAAFTDARYQDFLKDISNTYNYKPPFRIAETPVFITHPLKERLFEACELITDTICKPDFHQLSKGAVLSGQIVPNETPHTTFLQMDFGICKDENGEYIPQLIEVQGFPSLYMFQDLVANAYRKHFDIPDNYSHLFGGLDSAAYTDLFKKIVVGDSNPENVVLLEVEPDKQVTAIDFVATKHKLGIEYLCVTDLKKEGKDVYYIKNGKKIGVEKIYNRVIFDELIKRDDLKREFYFTQEANIEWIGHPHWFFRISKHTLPLLNNKYVPKSYFLNELKEYPEDLHNYVLKPLYSFAGTGVLININRYDLDAIEDKENYILQRKVEYAPVIPTPNVHSKCEIRMLMLWERGAARPVIVNNLARLSKGEMVGVRYNKDKDWVGGSVGFFEQ
jgi:hypothetical protein